MTMRAAALPSNAAQPLSATQLAMLAAAAVLTTVLGGTMSLVPLVWNDSTTFVSSALATALILCTVSPTLGGVFQFMAILASCATLWLYFAVCVAALVRRIAMPAAAIGLVFSLFAFWGAGWEAAGLSVVLMLTAIPLYFLRPKATLVERPT